MPLSKLQQALKAQQSQASIAAAKKKSIQNKEAKEASLKHSAKEKKVLKRVRQARRPESEVADGVDAGNDELTVIDGDAMLAQEQEEAEMQPVVRGKKGKGKAVNPNQLPVIPFDKADTILLLGEANFSYTLSLLSAPHSHPAHQMLATSYDTERECYLKYPDGEGNVRKLREKGVKVEFRVDAGNLEKCKAVGKGRWSKVIFNFPHAGAGITDQDRNILTNQHLLLRTLRSVAPMLTSGPLVESKPSGSKRKQPVSDDDDEDEDDEVDDISEPELSEADADEDDDDEMDGKTPKTAPTPRLLPPKRQGSILITLLNQPPYTLWSLPQLAQRPPPTCPGTRFPQPRYTLLRSFRFHPDLYPGYAHRRTIGWKEGKSKSDNEEILGRQGEARTWEFVKYEPKDKDKSKRRK